MIAETRSRPTVKRDYVVKRVGATVAVGVVAQVIYIVIVGGF